eukprot:scaffold7987_cov200-Cylindrotheca_fusiformis.AAC.14
MLRNQPIFRSIPLVASALLALRYVFQCRNAAVLALQLTISNVYHPSALWGNHPSKALTALEANRNYADAKRTSSRRRFVQASALGGITAAIPHVVPSDASSADTPAAMTFGSAASSVELGSGLLESRVMENLMNPPTYGLEIPDIYYPSYFAGVWEASSVATRVEAPCGVPLFGGNNTFTAAQNDLGKEKALGYRARFVSDGAGKVVADREFNVREIAKATMGANSVVDVPLATPNKFCCLLAPSGSPNLLTVAIIALARREESNEKTFDCSEVVRQIVAPANQKKPQTVVPMQAPSRRSTTLLKEIETISLYSPVGLENGKVDKITCNQRTATFLLPSQEDPVAYQMWQMTRGRPIDVRFYDVTYTRQT